MEWVHYPRYQGSALARVLPAIATSLGVPGLFQADDRALPVARRAVVVLVDGLGWELLARRSGHAPWLRSQLPSKGAPITVGFPTTTATSMGTLGVGCEPGVHGLVGYEAWWPQEQRVFNALSWQDGPVARSWQPYPTVFEQAAAEGVAVTRIGPGHFDGSGLTQAAQRGGDFTAADSPAARVSAARAALDRSPRALVYVYWGELDKVGHVRGSMSWQWGDELEALDAHLAQLAQSLPSDCALHVTADHGMVDVALDQRIDLAQDADLDFGIHAVAGEPRCLQLQCHPGKQPEVLSRWQERLADRAWVVSRQEAIDAGLFGQVDAAVVDRLGEVLVLAGPDFAVEDSRIHRPEMRALIGLHGSLTAQEVVVPWVAVHPTAG